MKKIIINTSPSTTKRKQTRKYKIVKTRIQQSQDDNSSYNSNDLYDITTSSNSLPSHINSNDCVSISVRDKTTNISNNTPPQPNNSTNPDTSLQSSTLSHKNIKADDESHTILSSPDSSTIHPKIIMTSLLNNSMEKLKSKTRTLSFNHSTDIPVMYTELYQHHSSCLISSSMTSKCPNEASLKDEGNTRLSSPNSNS